MVESSVQLIDEWELIDAAAAADVSSAVTTDDVTETAKYDRFVAIATCNDLGDGETLSVKFEEYDGSSWSDLAIRKVKNSSGSTRDTEGIVEINDRQISTDTTKIRASVVASAGTPAGSVAALGGVARSENVTSPPTVTTTTPA